MVDKDAVKKRQTMLKLQAELARLKEDKDLARLDTVVNELKEVREQNELSEEEFYDIFVMTFKRPKREKVNGSPTTPVEMVTVKIGTRVEEWPSRRTGQLPANIKTLMESNQVNTYPQLVDKLRVDKRTVQARRHLEKQEAKKQK